jgi:hypothetical protein
MIKKYGLIVALIFSLAINVVTVGVLLVYLLTYQLDFIVMSISAPRMCRVLEQHQSEKQSTKLFCELFREGVLTGPDKERLKTIINE